MNTNHRIASSNGIKITHEDEEFASLVSNLSLFNETYSEQELHQWNVAVGPDGFPDDSDYSNQKTLEEIIRDEYFRNPEPPTPNIFFDCIVRIDLIWSSDSDTYDPKLKLMGCDRPRAQILKKESHLNDLREVNPITGKENKGFSVADCMKLAGQVRVQYKEDEGGYVFTLVKTEGNGRFVKKLIANFDPADPKYTRILYLPFTIFFHPQDASLEVMNKGEAGQHHVDAEKRITQNEAQKFASGIAMGNPASVYCKKFLTELELDFKEHMNEERKIMKEKPWPSISSISRINQGEGKGMFSFNSKKGNQPGYDFTKLGFQTAREIAKDITEEDLIMSTSAQTFASMYHSFCTDHHPTQVGRKAQKALFTVEELKEYFLTFFRKNNIKHSNDEDLLPEDEIKLKNLSLSGGIKSLEYLAITVFWEGDGRPKIGRWWKRNVFTKDGQARKNGFTSDHDCAVNFILKADKLLRELMKTAIDKQ